MGVAARLRKMMTCYEAACRWVFRKDAGAEICRESHQTMKRRPPDSTRFDEYVTLPQRMKTKYE